MLRYKKQIEDQATILSVQSESLQEIGELPRVLCGKVHPMGRDKIEILSERAAVDGGTP